MAYVITDYCVSCGTCADECPNEAISEGDGKYVIDPDKCVDCGTCADECPTTPSRRAKPQKKGLCSGTDPLFIDIDIGEKLYEY